MSGRQAPNQRYEVAIIGGGILGMATAMALLGRGARSLIVLEAEKRLAAHQTGNNSGVIHSGLYYKPGSLKAQLCAAGRESMYNFCREFGIPHEACGKIVVAAGEHELPALAELERRGVANGLIGLRRLSADELRAHEPHVKGIAGLHVPQTGITDYTAVTRAMAGLVRDGGSDVRTDAKVRAVHSRVNAIVLETSRGEVECDGLINCAGLHSDRVARMCGLEPELRIVPFRGEYYTLTPRAAGLVRNLIYPVPDPRFPFLGVHFTRMIAGGVEAGPNAVLSLARHGYRRFSFNFADALDTAAYGGTWRMARKFWKPGLGELHRSLSKRAFLRALRKLLPELAMEDIVPGGCGIRAQAIDHSGALVDDFRIVRARRMVHVLNAPSPGATASIAIGRHIADLAADSFAMRQRRQRQQLVTS